jgi:hypothetical protein
MEAPVPCVNETLMVSAAFIHSTSAEGAGASLVGTVAPGMPAEDWRGPTIAFFLVICLRHRGLRD